MPPGAQCQSECASHPMSRAQKRAGALGLLTIAPPTRKDGFIKMPRHRRVLRDVVYGDADGRPLLLDLHLPTGSSGPWPVILWVHGGGWRRGDKGQNVVAARMTNDGYAVASVGYRLSVEATFPAQIYDCKAAVRWIRAKGVEYGLDADRIGAWGPSAGGHLVALLGTSGDLPELEGDCGHPGYSTRVQAVCDWFGPTDLVQMGRYPSDIDHDAPDSPESQLLGGPVQERVEMSRRANPLTYIHKIGPPFLIMHGAVDRIVPKEQSVLLHKALVAAGGSSSLHLIPGAGHGGDAFAAEEVMGIVKAFFQQHLT